MISEREYSGKAVTGYILLIISLLCVIAFLIVFIIHSNTSVSTNTNEEVTQTEEQVNEVDNETAK